MTYNQLVKLLEENGWRLKRTGKHRIYVHDDFVLPLVVPFHSGKEVPKGTLVSILKKAGLK